MKRSESVRRLGGGTRVNRVAAWACALIFAGAAAGSFAAETTASATSLRVVESSTGGISVEWVRTSAAPGVLGWHLERCLPDGRILRLTDSRVEADLFASPSHIYRVPDSSISIQVGDVLSYRLVSIDPELQEQASSFELYPVERELPPAPAPAKASRRTSPPGFPDHDLFRQRLPSPDWHHK